MDAVGASVTMITPMNKGRKVFRECTVTEYINAYDGEDWQYYWKCIDTTSGDQFTFDWSDIVSGLIYFNSSY